MGRGSVFISGSARGIGRATAERFRAAGYLVGVYDVDTEAAAWAAGRDGYVVGSLDVRDFAAWEAALADFAGHAGGAIDIVVNNAGVLYAGPFVDADADADRRLVEINVIGVMNGARAAHPHLLRSGRGQLVNIASAAAIYGTPEMATYSATKFAVRGLTEALEQEWEADGIRVISIWPLFAATALLDGVSTAGTERMGVRLTPEDVAATVFSATRPRRLRLPQVHFPVGLQARSLALGARFSPAWVTRASNAWLTRGR